MVEGNRRTADGATVIGHKTGSFTGPYGDDDAYRGHVIVEVDGTRTEVPVDGVQISAFDRMSAGSSFDGRLPERVDVDRITADGDELHAEAMLSDGAVVELFWDRNGNIIIQGFGPEDPADFPPLVWERDGSMDDDLARLHRLGMSAAEALDYWGCIVRGRTAKQQASRRDVSHQAVSKNVREAKAALEETPR
jgi:hypothetical protein